MIARLPKRPANDNAVNAIWICPLCENGSFLLEAAPDDTVIIKCAKCFADCTRAVAANLPIGIDRCQP
jgi:hypothetical protein